MKYSMLMVYNLHIPLIIAAIRGIVFHKYPCTTCSVRGIIYLIFFFFFFFFLRGGGGGVTGEVVKFSF